MKNSIQQKTRKQDAFKVSEIAFSVLCFFSIIGGFSLHSFLGIPWTEPELSNESCPSCGKQFELSKPAHRIWNPSGYDLVTPEVTPVCRLSCRRVASPSSCSSLSSLFSWRFLLVWIMSSGFSCANQIHSRQYACVSFFLFFILFLTIHSLFSLSLCLFHVHDA